MADQKISALTALAGSAVDPSADSTVIVDNSAGATKRILMAEAQLIRQNSQSADYTLLITDANIHLLHPAADTNNRVFTIPANASVAFSIGTTVTIVNMVNTITVAITTDTMTLLGAGGTGSRTLAANGVATALKIAATSWVIWGLNLT